MPDYDAAIEPRPASTGLGSRALRNTVIVLTAKVVARLIALVTVLYIIHYLPADRYGSFTTLVNYTAIVSVLLDLGFNTLFVREGARHHFEIQRYLRNVMSLRLLMSVVSLGLLAILLTLNRLGDQSREIDGTRDDLYASRFDPRHVEEVANHLAELSTRRDDVLDVPALWVSRAPPAELVAKQISVARDHGYWLAQVVGNDRNPLGA